MKLLSIALYKSLVINSMLLCTVIEVWRVHRVPQSVVAGVRLEPRASSRVKRGCLSNVAPSEWLVATSSLIG